MPTTGKVPTSVSASVENSVYMNILKRKHPPCVLMAGVYTTCDITLDDFLEDPVFIKSILDSVGSEKIILAEDMLLIPALQCLARSWALKSPEYTWAIENYPELVDRLATIGLALAYQPSEN